MRRFVAILSDKESIWCPLRRFVAIHKAKVLSVSSETLLIIYWFLQPHCWINLHTITMISFSNIYCLCSKVESPSLPFKHSACIWSYYGMVIDTYHFMDQSRCTRNDVPCIEWNSYVVQMHRNKRYGKAEKKWDRF